MDPNEASLFFIPYDLGMDGSTRTSDAALFQTNCPRVSRVMDLLRESPHFRRNNDSNSAPYAVSRLCLMPGGDFPTRKGFLDGMLSGCVPVTFQLASAQDQWPLHWITKDTAMRCTVYIPRDSAMRDMHTTFNRLLTLSVDRAVMTDKLKCMREVSQRFQYSLPDIRGSGEEVDALTSETQCARGPHQDTGTEASG
eukprot:gene22542-28674_t